MTTISRPKDRPPLEPDQPKGVDVAGLGRDLEAALKKAGGSLNGLKATIGALKKGTTPSNAALVKLRDTVNEVAAKARENDKAAAAKALSGLNRLVRRLERATR